MGTPAACRKRQNTENKNESRQRQPPVLEAVELHPQAARAAIEVLDRIARIDARWSSLGTCMHLDLRALSLKFEGGGLSIPSHYDLRLCDDLQD